MRVPFGHAAAAALIGFIAHAAPAQESRAAKLERRQERIEKGFTIDTISSPYIEVAIDELGSFTVGTLLGDPNLPSDDNAGLLYGHPLPGTGQLTLRVDGTDQLMIDMLVVSPGQVISTTAYTSTFAFSGVNLEQRLSIVNGRGSGVADTLLIEYVMTNTTSSAVTAGVRLLLDTEIDDNDGNLFEITGVGVLTNELEYLDPNVLDEWTAFDDPNSPEVTVLANYVGDDLVKPDRLIFGPWPSMFVTDWDYTVTGAAISSDSAVLQYWNPTTLAPGASRTVGMSYGVYSDPPVASAVNAGLWALYE